jgi:hypothetical protein
METQSGSPLSGTAGAPGDPTDETCSICSRPGTLLPRSPASDGVVGLTALVFLLALSLFVLAAAFNWQSLSAFGAELAGVAVIGSIVGFAVVFAARHEALASSRAFDAEVARIGTESARQDATLSQARLAAAALALMFSSVSRAYADARSLSMRLLLAATAFFALSLVFASVLADFFGWALFFSLGLGLVYLAMVFLLVNAREYIPPLRSEMLRWSLWPDLPPRWAVVCDSIAGDPHLLALAQDLHLNASKMPKSRRELLDRTRPVY